MAEFNWIEIFKINETTGKIEFSDYTQKDEDANHRLQQAIDTKNQLKCSTGDFVAILENIANDKYESRFDNSYKDVVKVVKDNGSVRIEFLYKTIEEKNDKNKSGFTIDLYNHLIYAYLIEVRMFIEQWKS